MRGASLVVIASLLLGSIFLLRGQLQRIVGQRVTSNSSGSGGTSSSTPTPSAPNVVPITVSQPALATGVFNVPLISVTICVPGTSNCLTINGIAVDTGSTGLRIFQNVNPLWTSLPVTTLNLPNQTGVLAECAPFAQGANYWGIIQTADVIIGGEKASSVPIQTIGANTTTSLPSNGCAQNVPTQSTTGFNGVLGVGGLQDCSQATGFANTSTPWQPGPNPCVSSAASSNYWLCGLIGLVPGCQQVTASLAKQVNNPVSLFPTDNNGVIVELPSISSNGATNVSGSLVFGIGTQTNNGLGNATVFFPFEPGYLIYRLAASPRGTDSGVSYR